MHVILGLGNPGPEYDAHRHNVGWWAVDRLAYDWDFGSFERQGRAHLARGVVEGLDVTLVKPTTYMNRSGQALRFLAEEDDFDPSRQLMVVVDDASLDVGRVRFRPSGGAGGHNGLKSVAGALGSEAYPRCRVGVGRKPDGRDLADWVLSEMPTQDEDAVVALLPELTTAMEVWLQDDMETVMNRFNR